MTREQRKKQAGRRPVAVAAGRPAVQHREQRVRVVFEKVVAVGSAEADKREARSV